MGMGPFGKKKPLSAFLELITVFVVFIFAVASGHYQPLSS
jgi:hypothetical protein